MKKILMTACLVMGLAGAAGCASQEPATDLLKDAAAAMENTGNAKECAAETYALAQNALKEAQAAQEAGDIETARQKARLAQTLASAAVEEILNDELSGGPVFVLDESFKVIYFDFDESFLSSSAVQALQANVAVLKAKPEMNVILAAHTDDRGTTEYNIALSQRRGDAVKAHATSLGIDASRMSVVPYGKEMPASHGTREQDYALNRRVEFIPR